MRGGPYSQARQCLYIEFSDNLASHGSFVFEDGSAWINAGICRNCRQVHAALRLLLDGDATGWVADRSSSCPDLPRALPYRVAFAVRVIVPISGTHYIYAHANHRQTHAQMTSAILFDQSQGQIPLGLTRNFVPAEIFSPSILTRTNGERTPRRSLGLAMNCGCTSSARDLALGQRRARMDVLAGRGTCTRCQTVGHSHHQPCLQPCPPT
jgi:hypothetical protein